ncbi:MAG: oxaloacetate decarboxylase, gamma subunit [Candidatus Kentron sp. G]|nr:MAG: oxaloacetate decarboxylase, gamma subunit [Candidatus Kentron sp. G]VFN07645.1 MAG: oxaloacetate decarboxylase, gamma subunit [Candidatus Kentron sp. G]
MTEVPVNELLSAGVNLMLMGMGVVFVLLGLMVVTVGGMSRLAHKIAGDPILPEPPAERPAATPNQQILAVIGSAVHKYRRSRG